ncbi:XVIPCD domain-containing protein [Xanthomonas euvesicatoria]|uniref:XVIPCD domain-containing protein n=1 Tax=Xanthomonas euvesicatoria TaxID=456327 RepID=UPI0031B9AF07
MQFGFKREQTDLGHSSQATTEQNHFVAEWRIVTSALLPGSDRRLIAGALAMQAKLHRPPLAEIQEVIPSQTNGNAFATHKNPGTDMDVLRTHVDKGEAVKQPLAENLQKLETATRQAVQAPAQEASRSIDQPSPGARGLR